MTYLRQLVTPDPVITLVARVHWGYISMSDVSTTEHRRRSVAYGALVVVVDLWLAFADAAVGTVIAVLRPVDTAAYVMARAVEGDGPTAEADPWVLSYHSTPPGADRAARGARDGHLTDRAPL